MVIKSLRRRPDNITSPPPKEGLVYERAAK
jgi:hypothetical protein